MFTAKDIGKFFDIPYYTHGPNQIAEIRGASELEHQPKQSLLDRIMVHLAWRLDRGVELTPDELGPANNRTLCDLGCGDGGNLLAFSNAGFDVVGVEPDAMARKHAKKVADVFDGTIEALPSEISSRKFDVVLLSHVLDVCVDVSRSLMNTRKIVNSEGVVVIEVPNFAAKGFLIYGAEWPWTDIPRHLTFFTERSLTRMLQVNGFSIKNVKYVGYTRQFLPFWKNTNSAIRREIGTPQSPDIPSYWWFLLTAFAPSHRKYDSIRVVATPTR